MLQAGLAFTASLGHAQWRPPEVLSRLATVGCAPEHSWQDWV